MVYSVDRDAVNRSVTNKIILECSGGVRNKKVGEELKVRKKKVGGCRVNLITIFCSFPQKPVTFYPPKQVMTFFWLFLSQISLFCVLNLVLSWLAVNVG